MKKYLNSVEEVVKALKEGKKITEVESKSVYQIIDGFLTEKQEKHGTLLNAVMPFNIDEYEYYTEEPEPLKFEVNRAYKTKGGYRAFLYIISNNNMAFLSPDYPNYQFFTNGLGLRTEESPFDIVGYWEEEK